MTTDVSGIPDPEFRAHLEWEVARAFRREASLGPRRNEPTRRRISVIGLVGACLILGVASNFAAAQVRDGARRDSLLDASRAEMQLMVMRLQLVQEQLAKVEQQRQLGLATDEALATATAAVRTMQTRLARMKLDAEEIQGGSASPRDDLGAPLVVGRDFVKERIQLELAEIQQRIAAAEAKLSDAERQVRIGVAQPLTKSEAEVALARTREEMVVAAKRLALRQEFLEQHTPADQLARQLDEAQRQADLEVAVRSLSLARDRLDQIRRQAAVGMTNDLEVMRAQLEMKEKELEVSRLRDQVAGKFKAKRDSLQ